MPLLPLSHFCPILFSIKKPNSASSNNNRVPFISNHQNPSVISIMLFPEKSCYSTVAILCFSKCPLLLLSCHKASWHIKYYGYFPHSRSHYRGCQSACLPLVSLLHGAGTAELKCLSCCSSIWFMVTEATFSHPKVRRTWCDKCTHEENRTEC